VFDLPLFVDRLRSANELSGAATFLSARMVILGSWTGGGVDVSVALVLAPSAGRAEELLRGLTNLITAGIPIAAVLPTTRVGPGVSRDLAAAGVIPIGFASQESLALNWQSVREWLRRDAGHHQDPAPTPASLEVVRAVVAEPPFLFRREDRHWILHYEGQPKIVDHLNGLIYVAALLAEPRKPFSPLELEAVAHGHARRGSDTAVAAALAAGLPMRGESGLDTLDRQAVAEYRQRLAELRTHELMGDLTDAEQDTIDWLEQQLRGGTALGNRRRTTGDPHHKARINILKQLPPAIERVAAKHEPLGLHLRNAIKTKPAFAYEPDREIRWVF
jgi:hypothetical protein